MPIRTLILPPELAFTVKYMGESIPIYHCYEDDDFDSRCDSIYTADIKEGIRDGKSSAEHRNDFWIDLGVIRQLVNSCHGVNKYRSIPHNHTMLLQEAIDFGLIDFDEEMRLILNEIKEVSHG